MFQHEKFDNYTFEEIPLNQDIYLIDECFLLDYEKTMLQLFNNNKYEYVGYVSAVAARKVNETSIELSWYANIYDRFHEISISLPRDQFVACVGSWQYDEKPRIFVKSSWLETIYLRSYSVFALIDAIDVKKAIQNGKLTREGLVKLRSKIDFLAANYPDISFISFADSILLKSNWSVGYFERNIKYSYKPEIFIYLANEINNIYQDELGLSTYAVITQGSNEYYDDALLHISESKNHISLNSLGVPFAQLMEIEATARTAIRNKVHPPSELYMDKQYFYSLKFKFSFKKKDILNNTYQTKIMGTPSNYYLASLKNILSNLEEQNL